MRKKGNDTMSDESEGPAKKAVEPLLAPNPQRFVLFPIKHNEVWAMYKKHVASFWVAEEVDLADDEKDWKTLTEDEQHFVKMVLAFFAASDGIVLENLAERFMNEVQVPEVRCFYGFQLAMENVHVRITARAPPPAAAAAC